jgi:adenylosuccinate lyase
VPEDALKEIQTKAKFQTDRVLEIEEEVHHDVIAFLTNLAENIGPSSRFVHYGLTSSDVVDTSLSVILQDAGKLILDKYKKYLESLFKQAHKYKDLVAVGRTHGVHAEPTTLGLKLLGYFEEAKRNYNRLEMALEESRFGKISGAVGTYSQLPPDLEAYVLKKMNLNVEPVSTQVIPRDRHAVLVNAISVAAQGISRLAQEVRLLQKTESREVEEPFQKGQKGSSAMPHKRNPVLCERMSGLARTIMGYSIAAQQNIPLWHERDISHSSSERIILPDATSLFEYMLVKMTFVVENLHVYEEGTGADRGIDLFIKGVVESY